MILRFFQTIIIPSETLSSANILFSRMLNLVYLFLQTGTAIVSLDFALELLVRFEFCVICFKIAVPSCTFFQKQERSNKPNNLIQA